MPKNHINHPPDEPDKTRSGTGQPNQSELPPVSDGSEPVEASDGSFSGLRRPGSTKRPLRTARSVLTDTFRAPQTLDLKELCNMPAPNGWFDR